MSWRGSAAMAASAERAVGGVGGLQFGDEPVLPRGEVGDLLPKRLGVAVFSIDSDERTKLVNRSVSGW